MRLKSLLASSLLLLFLACPAYAVSTATCYDTADTLFMLHMNGADTSTGFIDEIGATWTATNQAQIDTDQYVFGGASGMFDGSDDARTGDNAKWDVGTGDWTFDTRFRLRTVTGGQRFFDRSTDMTIRFQDDVGGGDEGINVVLEGTQYDFKGTIVADTWYHLAVVRASNNLYVFLNGTQIGVTTATTKDIQGSGGIAVGGEQSSGDDVDGWQDEVRWTTTPIWTSNFTPPSAAYTDCAVKKRVILT